MDVRPLDLDMLDAARRLLDANDLPTDDLADPSIQLLGAFEDRVLLGVIGLQRCGETGLLRSLVVTPDARDRGVARALCEHVFARATGLDGLWLLTTTASGYFERHGFSAKDRGSAPQAIRESAQFSSLCPSTAVVMWRSTARS